MVLESTAIVFVCWMFRTWCWNQQSCAGCIEPILIYVYVEATSTKVHVHQELQYYRSE